MAMKKITVGQVAGACCGRLFGNEKDADIVIKNIFTDSRKVGEGSLFAAIKGERVDGHDFIVPCFEKGAVCAISEKEIETDKPYILVDSTLRALKDIAAFYRGLFDIPFIGVTGSVGKTSTKEMLSSVLSQKFKVHKTQGNFNNELGVPLTIFGLEEEHEIAVIEMGISDFGEMTRLSKIVRPDFCLITNIGCCHLENLIDRDGVCKAKTEMFANMNPNGMIFLNGDDDKLAKIHEVTVENHRIVPIFYGISDKNTFHAENISGDVRDGIACDIVYDNVKNRVFIPSIGTYMVTNALAAFAVGKALGLSDEEIVKGIAAYETVGSRARVIDTGFITIIDDCYNANPTSVQGAVDTLVKFPGRKVAVLGDMKELGTKTQDYHIETGKYLHRHGVDVLVAVGELAKNIYLGAQMPEKSIYFATTEEACERIYDVIKENDTVLVKASHSMHFENITKALEKLK